MSANIIGRPVDRGAEQPGAADLVLTAHRTHEAHGRGRSEFHYGAFSRTLPLPEGANPEEISATYMDGVLQVAMPAVGTAKPQPVRIEIGTGT